MNDTSTVTARTLDVPGARLHYEVRGDGPLVALVGSPMDAVAFAPLADLLAEQHTVLTTDPRGVNRSRIDDLDEPTSVETRADDLSRLIAHLDAGPAVVLGSSGGAVTALALAQAHPEQVDTCVAHEPPLSELLDDREQRRRETEDVIDTYHSVGRKAAWAKFMSHANIVMPDEVFEQMFDGEPDPVQKATEDRFFGHDMRATTRWQPDVTALRSAGARIVVGVGEDSGGQLCDLTSTALAASLGIEPTTFPGGHTGFVEAPEAFTAALRAVLSER